MNLIFHYNTFAVHSYPSMLCLLLNNIYAYVYYHVGSPNDGQVGLHHLLFSIFLPPA